jgi:uncharacterized membrane protein
MKRDKTGLERIIFFSDAVFAIAITLLALDLRLPSNAGQDGLSNDLLHLWPEYQSYVTSFTVIGLYWISHHHYFQVYSPLRLHLCSPQHWSADVHCLPAFCHFRPG